MRRRCQGKPLWPGAQTEALPTRSDGNPRRPRQRRWPRRHSAVGVALNHVRSDHDRELPTRLDVSGQWKLPAEARRAAKFSRHSHRRASAPPPGPAPRLRPKSECRIRHRAPRLGQCVLVARQKPGLITIARPQRVGIILNLYARRVVPMPAPPGQPLKPSAVCRDDGQMIKHAQTPVHRAHAMILPRASAPSLVATTANRADRGSSTARPVGGDGNSGSTRLSRH